MKGTAVMPSCEKKIEDILLPGITVRIHPTGNSMRPLIHAGRDTVCLIKADPDKLAVGDLVLYRREYGALILHRIISRKKGSLYLSGDNNFEIEGPLAPEQIIGVATEITRAGKKIKTTDLLYRLYVLIWPGSRPLRRFLYSLRHRSS